MKRQIRKGIFETNSSSVHAISVTRDTDLKLPATIKFSLRNFGWEFSRYDNTSDKANYLWTAILQNFDWSTKDPEVLRRKDAIKNTLMSYGFSENKIIFHSRGTSDCGIDHGVMLSDLDKIIFDPDRLMRFLFNKDSVVCTFNDNSNIGLTPEEEEELDNKYKDENGDLPSYDTDVWIKWNTEYWVRSCNSAGLTTSKRPEYVFIKDN